MGAINFYGGTWCGGGAGFCYKEQTRTICTECGEEPINCTCEEPNFVEENFEREMYEAAKDHVYDFEAYVLEQCTDKFIRVMYKGKLKICRVSRILKGLNTFGHKWLNVRPGYYAGFQIYMDANDVCGLDWRDEPVYSEEPTWLDQIEAEDLATVVNEVLGNMPIETFLNIIYNEK